MVAELSPQVGLVLQMPFVCTRKGFASTYEQVCAAGFKLYSPWLNLTKVF
jgi:hypothetical protein